MSDELHGRILAGDANAVSRAYDEWSNQPVDREMLSADGGTRARFQTTIAKSAAVTGSGTFFGWAKRTLNFEPSDEEGWWLDRVDLRDSLPIRVDVSNVWTTVRNLVLCSGSPHNYMRMVEHVVALRLGMGLDNVVIRMNSGDPPLFDRSSMDLVEAVAEAGIVQQNFPVKYLTVKEPVTVGGTNGSFLTFLPLKKGEPLDLVIDCAVNFDSAIGKQRIKFVVNGETFRHGAFARTNTTMGKMIYCQTVGKLFADVRNLGYTRKNILIAGRERYHNEPRMIHEGKSLEAVWHRGVLDLLAAVALIGRGRFVGNIISYKSGHALDVLMIKRLYQNKQLVPVEVENS